MISYFFFLLYLYFSNFSSFLNFLLILESVSLVIFFSLTYIMFSYFSLKMLLLYFVFIVSESAIGLSILVKSVKFYGLNNFSTMNLSMF
uniref:NADH dehydrogenase subunit 4L n=1 Tax=Mycterothrips gongshanensis TaxID=2792509 RepID=UPI0022022C29|nr:NADH dehydrogenase subunit 4L [Mycterothrips gongshanensis]UXW64201.1 NADH dehydrogenase subunit 4L [Mycterothrips gongshanensis]